MLWWNVLIYLQTNVFVQKYTQQAGDINVTKHNYRTTRTIWKLTENERQNTSHATAYPDIDP
jgi:hypothetical protein